MSFDTKNTKKALRKLEQSGLFDEEQLKIASTWLREETTWLATPGNIAAVGMSPYKVAEMLGGNGKSIQGRCRTGIIKAERTIFDEWLIPADEIIRLAEEAWGDTIGEENIGGESRRLKT